MLNKPKNKVEEKNPNPATANIVDSNKVKSTSLGNNITSKLLLPMSVVFLAVCVSSSLIISSLIISKSIKDVNINVNSTGTATTVTTPTTAPIQPLPMDKVKAIFAGNYIKFGDQNRKVLFIEFSDPSCPFCHAAAGKNTEIYKGLGDQFKMKEQGGSYVAPVTEMKKLVDEGKASFAWVYTNGHGNGEMGTKALYCANEKGKFWEVHDLLMNNDGYNLLNNDVKNDKAKAQVLSDYLKSAVPADQMKSCLDSGKYDDRIANDGNVSKDMDDSANVPADQRGTPTFVVNSNIYNGAYGYDTMKTVVDAAL